MGYLYIYKCNQCREETTVYLGIGMMNPCRTIYDPEMFEQEDIRADLQKLSDEGSILHIETEHSAFYCSQCRSLASYMDFKVHLKSGDTYIPQFKCEVCGGNLKHITKGRIVRSARCPHCGGTFSQDVDYGLWD